MLDRPCRAYRKMIADLIEVYKMLNGRYDSDIKPSLALKSETEIRQTAGMFNYKERYKEEICRKFFRNRARPFCNDLPKKVTEAPALIHLLRKDLIHPGHSSTHI